MLEGLKRHTISAFRNTFCMVGVCLLQCCYQETSSNSAKTIGGVRVKIPMILFLQRRTREREQQQSNTAQRRSRNLYQSRASGAVFD